MRAKSFLGLGVVLLGCVLSMNGCGQRPTYGFLDSDPVADMGDASAGDATSDASDDSATFMPGVVTDSGAACATATVELMRSTIYMQIVLDGSGSMNDPIVAGGPTGRKWAAASDALVSFFEDLAQKNDSNFALGLFLFDGTKDVNGFTIPDVPIRKVDAAHLALLKNRIRGSTPAGGTPIKRALDGQLPVLKGFVPAAPVKPNGKHVLLVITDGVPDGPADIQDTVQGQCVTLLENAYTGIPRVTTFAIGVGDPASDPSTYNEVFMGRLAVAGGASSPTCTPGWNESSPAGQVPCHIQITPGQKTATQLRNEFIAAIDTIRGAAASCDFTLEHGAGAGVLDPTKVNVVVTDSNGTETTVPQNPTDGWSYDDPQNPTKVTFNGASCSSLTGAADRVSIVLGCKTIVN